MYERTPSRLILITGLNGFSITVVAAAATLASLVIAFGWPALLIGLAVTFSGILEIKGHYLLKSGRLDGLQWARKSQVGVLLALVTYSGYSLLALSPQTALQNVSPLSRDILLQYYGIDEEVLGELLYLVGQATYSAVALASLVYQGSLYWYYGRQQRRFASDPKQDSGTRGKESSRKPIVIESPTILEAAGNKPKRMEEFIGRVNSRSEGVSIARMKSPRGWMEPGQTPEFDEYTLVLHGVLRVSWKGGTSDVKSGQALITHRGEWVQYSTPLEGGAEYIAVCIPAFSPATVHRDNGQLSGP